MLTDVIIAVVSAGLGFIGGFIVMKYETKAAAKIQSQVNDVTATVETKVDQAVAAAKATDSK